MVWGLSILDHVPRNSLLESMANILTDRLRKECGDAKLSPPTPDTAPDTSTPSTAAESRLTRCTEEERPFPASANDENGNGDGREGPSPSSSGKGVAATGSRLTVGPATGTDVERATSVSVSASAVVGGPSGRTEDTNASTSGGEGAGDGGSRRVPGDGGVVGDGGNSDGTGAASAASKGVAEATTPVTSGTDLATAALSFAYAHARCEVAVLCQM